MYDLLERILTNEDLDWELDPEVEEILSFLHSYYSLKSFSFKRLEYGNGLKPKPSVEELPEAELKPIPSNLKYVFLNPPSSLPVVIAAGLHETEDKLLWVLKGNKEAFGWNIHDIKGLDSTLGTHKINTEDGLPPKRLPQRRLNPNIMKVVKG